MADENVKPSPGEGLPAKDVRRVRVWDLPTRTFHWLLVLLVTVSFFTGKMSGTLMQYHEWSGVAILGLILFRVLWGFWGGTPSRFATFVCAPRKVFDYARSLLGKGHEAYLGHNPMGAYSILAMLTALLVQAGTGLFANDDIFTEGPLAHLVGKATSDWLTRIHLINQNIIVALVVLHLAAILFYWVVKRENLVLPMVTGRKHWHEAVRDADGHPAKALILAAILGAGLYWVIY
jgi:cytochrome b